MKHRSLIALLILTWSAAGARAQTPGAAPPSSHPCYVGTSLFMLANLASDDQPPHFYQLNVGCQLTPKDRLSVETITWRYYHPLGIPWGESGDSPDNAYPGCAGGEGGAA